VAYRATVLWILATALLAGACGAPAEENGIQESDEPAAELEDQVRAADAVVRSVSDLLGPGASPERLEAELAQAGEDLFDAARRIEEIAPPFEALASVELLIQALHEAALEADQLASELAADGELPPQEDLDALLEHLRAADEEIAELEAMGFDVRARA
jgi:hypothetical protein